MQMRDYPVKKAEFLMVWWPPVENRATGHSLANDKQVDSSLRAFFLYGQDPSSSIDFHFDLFLFLFLFFFFLNFGSYRSVFISLRDYNFSFKIAHTQYLYTKHPMSTSQRNMKLST